MRDDADFYARLPVFDGFENIMDPANYTPLPDGWLLGLADVVDSRSAIDAGRYKTVNTAGAAVIAAVKNALAGRNFPFIFGGDGASFAVAPVDETPAREALAAAAAFARDELDLALRVAMAPVRAVRDAGLDVRVARYAASPSVSYAMFAGGGLAFAEAAMKQGRFAVSPAAEGIRPDLSGLSCRWQEIPAAKGVILSLIAVPARPGDPRFRAFVEALLSDIETSNEAARPVPDGGPGVGWPPAGFDLEARASRKAGERLAARRASLLASTLVAYVIMRLGVRVGSFDPAVYRREVVENSDFRKYDDGLRMTLDCTPGFADTIERRLSLAEAEGLLRFGLHRQPGAIMTCIVPSVSDSDHMHFIDGAAGGYAAAAGRLQPRSTAANAPVIAR